MNVSNIHMKCVQCFTLTFLKTVNSFLAKDYNSILYFDFASRGTGRYIMQLPITIELFLSYVEPGRLSTDRHPLSLIARASYLLFLSSSTVPCNNSLKMLLCLEMFHTTIAFFSLFFNSRGLSFRKSN